MRSSLGLAIGVCLLSGCVSGPSRTRDAGTTTTATTIDPVTATPRYWMDKPADATVTAGNFDRLWAACDASIRGYRFVPDVQNFRQGIMTSKPLVSKGVGEFWRNDVIEAEDLGYSTVATFRRTIRCDISKLDSDRYEVAIRVLVERSSAFERRVTTGIQYRDVFGPFPANHEFRSDDGATQQPQYWYATGRDAALEAALAEKIKSHLELR